MYRAAVFEQRVAGDKRAQSGWSRFAIANEMGRVRLLAAAVAAVKGSEQRRLLFDNPENTRNSWMRTSLRDVSEMLLASRRASLLVKRLHICLVRRWTGS